MRWFAPRADAVRDERHRVGRDVRGIVLVLMLLSSFRQRECLGCGAVFLRPMPPLMVAVGLSIALAAAAMGMGYLFSQAPFGPSPFTQR